MHTLSVALQLSAAMMLIAACHDRKKPSFIALESWLLPPMNYVLSGLTEQLSAPLAETLVFF
jgi:hypothetical protein